MFEFLIKLFLTPENVFEVFMKLTNIIGMCFIFYILKIDWWKSLIPFYDKLLIYEKIFKHKFVIFMFDIFFIILNSRCIVLMKKYLIINLLQFVKTQNIYSMDISFLYLILLLFFYILSVIILFLINRISNFKIIQKLGLNIFFQIGTFLLPELFLLINSIYYIIKRKKGNSNVK